MLIKVNNKPTILLKAYRCNQYKCFLFKLLRKNEIIFINTHEETVSENYSINRPLIIGKWEHHTNEDLRLAKQGWDEKVYDINDCQISK